MLNFEKYEEIENVLMKDIWNLVKHTEKDMKKIASHEVHEFSLRHFLLWDTSCEVQGFKIN